MTTFLQHKKTIKVVPTKVEARKIMKKKSKTTMIEKKVLTIMQDLAIHFLDP